VKTLVDLTPSVAAAVKKLQKAEGLVLSEGAKMDVTNVSEVLEALDR
jgi:hypothetical protein